MLYFRCWYHLLLLSLFFSLNKWEQTVRSNSHVSYLILDHWTSSRNQLLAVYFELLSFMAPNCNRRLSINQSLINYFQLLPIRNGDYNRNSSTDLSKSILLELGARCIIDSFLLYRYEYLFLLSDQHPNFDMEHFREISETFLYEKKKRNKAFWGGMWKIRSSAIYIHSCNCFLENFLNKMARSSILQLNQRCPIVQP